LNFELQVFSTENDLANSAKEIFVDLHLPGRDNTFIVPGGRTPIPFFHKLARLTLDWNRTTLILSDERLVSEESPDSNIGMLKKNFVDLLEGNNNPYLVPVVNGFPTEQSTKILDSLNYSTKSLVPPKAAFLGIGSDGHTASLFPDSVEDYTGANPFCMCKRFSEPFERISITMDILCSTPRIIFLVSGVTKKSIVKKLMKSTKSPNPLPVQQVIENSVGEIMVLCDNSALPE